MHDASLPHPLTICDAVNVSLIVSRYLRVPLFGLVGILVFLGTLSLIGVLAFYIGYQIFFLIRQLAIPPIPSGSQFLSFSAFGSAFATTIFLVILTPILFRHLRSKTDPISEYENLHRRYMKWHSIAFTLILSGPFLGAMIGVLGGLKDLNRKLSTKMGLEFGKGVLVGVIGGTVLLSALGGLLLVWTSWRRKRLSLNFDEQARKRVDVRPSKGEARKVVDIEQPIEKVRKSESPSRDVEEGMKKDPSDGPPSNFIFE